MVVVFLSNVCIYRCFFFPLIDCLFSSTLQTSNKTISYIKYFFFCLWCVFMFSVSQFSFQITLINDFSQKASIFFSPLSIVLNIFLFDMCLFDVSLMYMKGSMNELVFAFGQVILFSFFFILSYFNITKTLIIKISMLWFWCWDIYDQLINQCLWVLRKEVHKKKKEANQPKTKT